MRVMRPLSVISDLRDQARRRPVIDYEAGRRMRALQEARLEYRDWIEVGSPEQQVVDPDYWGWHSGWANATLDPQWELYTNEPRNTAAFFRDRWGFVHLKGVIDNPNHEFNWAFAVPDDLAPAKQEYFASQYKTTQTKAAGSQIADLGTTLIAYGCIVGVGPYGTSSSGAIEVVNFFEPGPGPVRTLSLDGMSWRAWNAGTLP